MSIVKVPKGCLLNEQLTVVQSVLHPGIYLHEVQNVLVCATGKHVRVSTTLSRLGFTRQKIQIIALQQSEELRLKFMAALTV